MKAVKLALIILSFNVIAFFCSAICAQEAANDPAQKMHEQLERIIPIEQNSPIYSAMPLQAVGPAADLSPILILWSLVKGQYTGISTAYFPGSDGNLSAVLGARSSASFPEILPNVFGYIHGIVSGTVKLSPIAECTGSQIDYNTCCLQSPYPECLAHFDWSFCKDVALPQPCVGLQKTAAMLTMVVSIAQEFAPSSRLMTIDEIKTGLEGGSVFFYWPYKTKDDPTHFLITKIDGDIIDRILSLTSAALPTMRRIKDRAPGAIGVQCSDNKVEFKPILLSQPPATNFFYISLGKETSARMPPSKRAAWSMSLYVESMQQTMEFVPAAGVRPRLENGPHWVSFLEIANQDPGRVLFCLTNTTIMEMKKVSGQMNNSEAGLFVFGISYLDKVYSDFSQ